MDRTSKKPNAQRRHFYVLAVCKRCPRSASARSENAMFWEIGAAPPCQPTDQSAACGEAPAAPAAATVECFCCLDDKEAVVSCPEGHHLCETCINKTLEVFEYGACNAMIVSLKLPVDIDINTMPFLCTACAEHKVSSSFSPAACLKFCSQATINSLFNKLRKFQLLSGNPQQPAVETSSGEPQPIHQQLPVGIYPRYVPLDPSEIATVTQTLRMFFEPPKCPSCRTPFAHDGGCMSMSCRGRPGLLCNVKFCLWCVHIANLCHLFHVLAGA